MPGDLFLQCPEYMGYSKLAMSWELQMANHSEMLWSHQGLLTRRHDLLVKNHVIDEIFCIFIRLNLIVEQTSSQKERGFIQKAYRSTVLLQAITLIGRL